MADEKGSDDHVVCVPCNDPGWNRLENIDDLPSNLRAEIGHFFDIYKDLDPDRHSEVKGWGDRQAALETIDKARELFRENGGFLLTLNSLLTALPKTVLPPKLRERTRSLSIISSSGGPETWRSRRRACSSSRFSADNCSSRPSFALSTALFSTLMVRS